MRLHSSFYRFAKGQAGRYGARHFSYAPCRRSVVRFHRFDHAYRVEFRKHDEIDKRREYVTVSEAGSHVISAISDSETLVPPVCVAVIEAVSESESETAADTAAETKTDTDKNAAEPDKEQSAQTSDMSAAVAVCAFAAVAVCVMLNVKRRRADR